MAVQYYSGQGKMFFAELTGDVRGPLKYLGKTPMAKFDLKTKVLEHQESESGQRMTDFRLDQGSTATITSEVEDLVKENYQRFLRGTSVAIAAGTVTGEALPLGIEVGDYANLENTNVSAVVIKDSALVPATLVLGTDYEIESAGHGTIKFLNIGAYVQPFKADYANGAATSIPMFNQSRKTYFVRFEGLNTSDSDAPVLVEFYRFQMDPSGFDLKSDAMSKFTVNGTVLQDASKPKDGALGQFGRVVING